MGLADKITMAGLSDTGMERTDNEDRLFFDRELGVAVVADGIGGARAGEVASSLAVTMIADEFKKEATRFHTRESNHPEECQRWLRGVLHQANQTIHQVANSQPQYKGMGVAVVLAFFHDNRVVVAHVGDCRLYRLRGQQFQQVTKDHTIFQEMLSLGRSQAEVRSAVRRNILTQALGPMPTIQPSIQELAVEPGDLFLLCSDGLTDMLNDEQIQAVLMAEEDLETRTANLIKTANQAGGRDNVTTLLAQATAPYPAQSKWFSRLFR